MKCHEHYILRWGYTPTYTGFFHGFFASTASPTEVAPWDVWDADGAQADRLTVGQQELQALAILLCIR